MSGRTYGQLRRVDGGTRWELSQLEPHVALRLKQLFPSVPKASVGPFYFPNDEIHCADIAWFTSRYTCALSLADHAALVGGKVAFNRSQAEMERILLPDYVPPAYVGLQPGQFVRHYQAQAIELVRARRDLLLGDEGGLGKTYTAAGLFVAEPGTLPAAVVCESHMLRQWKEKIESFTTLRVHIVLLGKGVYDLPPADVYIFKYSQLAKWVEIAAKGIFKCVVFDEPQSLRAGTATLKGTAAKVFSDHASYRLGLTATPIYNYGTEMWNVMQFICPSALGSLSDFQEAWVGENNHIVNPKALGTYLREQHAMLRRLKSDIGLQLPKVSRIIEYVDYDAKEVAAVEDLARMLAIRATTGAFTQRGQAARELDLMVRQATGLSKARAVAQFVRMTVDAGEPVLLVGWHRAVYDIWLEELAELKPAMFTGSETGNKKNKEVDRFMAGETDVLIMSLRSAAGLDNLQERCSVVVIGELDWAPGVHEQIIWRVDREGQLKPVQVFYLVSEDGSDPPIMDVLGLKASEAKGIVDPELGVRKVDNDTTNFKRLVQRYLDKSSRATSGLSEEGVAGESRDIPDLVAG